MQIVHRTPENDEKDLAAAVGLICSLTQGFRLEHNGQSS